MKTILTVICCLIISVLSAQSSYTDSSFGTNGMVKENTSSPYNEVIGATLQTDGKSVVLLRSNYNLLSRIVLIRRLTNGRRDSAFGNNGVADPAILPNIDYFPKALQLQTDGKILVCGNATYFPTGSIIRPFVARFTTGGTIDSTFAINGFFFPPTFRIGTSSFTVTIFNSMVIQPDGKVVLLSPVDNFPTRDLTLLRLNTNGRIDSSFATNGLTTLDTYNFSANHFKILLQTDGKFIIGGRPNTVVDNPPLPPVYYNSAFFRINTNGTFDSSFGTNGKVLLGPGSNAYNYLLDIVIQPDGKILGSGRGSNVLTGETQYHFVLRMKTDGTLDSTFGNSGRTYLYDTVTRFARLGRLTTLQADGKLLLAGHTLDTLGNSTLAVARITTDGRPDSTFNGDGIASRYVNVYDSYGIVPLQETNGNILLAGYAGDGVKQTSVVGRLNPNGQSDNTIDVANTAVPTGSGTDDETPRNLLLQSDQKIITVRGRYNGNAPQLLVARHLTNGRPDNTYGNNGKSYVNMPFNVLYASGKIIDSSKVLVAAVNSGGQSATKLGLAKLNIRGVLDSSFGVNGRIVLTLGGPDLRSNAIFQFKMSSTGKMLVYLFQQIVRLNPNATFDSSFNGTGKVIFPYFDSIRYEVIAVQPDNKILLSGSAFTTNGNITYTIRLKQDGTIDTSFNGGVHQQNRMGSMIKLMVQSNGKILLFDDSTAIGRLNSNGSKDTIFGTGGICRIVRYFPRFTSISDAIMLDSGKMLVEGTTAYSATVFSGPTLIKIKANGTPDSSFGINGALYPKVSGNLFDPDPNTMVLQADGKLLLLGDESVLAKTNNWYNTTIIGRLKSTGLFSGRTYTFNGSGNWSDVSNWAGGILPPTIIQAGNQIIINNATGGQCIIDVPVRVEVGALFTVSAGSRLMLPGNLTIE